MQLKGEVAVRNQLLHAMAEQQNLMDALTAVSFFLSVILWLCVCFVSGDYDYVWVL